MLSKIETKNRFSKTDHEIVRQGLSFLTQKEREAIMMRFWENHSIYEIAFWLCPSWDHADNLLKSAFSKLKNYCLSHPDFSRSTFRPMQISNAA